MDFKGTNENWEYWKPTDKFDARTISESGKIIGVCTKNSEADRANEQLRSSALYLLKALVALTDNIDAWLESGEPTDEKTSKQLYDNAKIAIDKAIN